MTVQRRIKSLSNITKKFLTQGESEQVDFKKAPEGVNAEDIVAFANNTNGGTILIGITEAQNANGTQFGSVVGCDVSDGAILQIVNKAIGCFPPISIEVFIENIAHKPILRVSVPESENKPHCTPKGVYCTRDGNRNRPLHPSELLRIFLDNEGRAFAQRFNESADKINDHIAAMETTIKRSIQSISNTLGWAEYQLGDTESALDSIKRTVIKISDDTDDTLKRLRALFRQDNRDDPVRSEAKQILLDGLIKELKDKPALLKGLRPGSNVSFNAPPKVTRDLEHDEISKIVHDAIEKAKQELNG